MIGNTERFKVLVVDDQPENIRVLVDAISDDYQVIAAKNGKKAIERALLFLPDIILLDIMMPGIDGYEVCRRLKQNEKTKNIPIIFITAIDDSQNEVKGLQLGAVDYIRKPFNLAVTRTRINNHLLLKRKTDMLENMLRIDGLTEIHNRRGFDETLDKQWRISVRTEQMVSLILMDVDFFKKYNDCYGHCQGDKCLVSVAQTIRFAVKRASDYVARYGGEEFVVILPGINLESAVNIAEIIREKIEMLQIPHKMSSVGGGYVTISAGVASVVPEIGAAEHLLTTLADEALYSAKESGRNKVVAFSSNSKQ